MFAENGEMRLFWARSGKATCLALDESLSAIKIAPGVATNESESAAMASNTVRLGQME